MSARGVLRVIEGGKVGFWCPGCEEMHVVRVSSGSGDWGFNGNYDRPTFTPSVLVTGVDITPKGEAQYDAWVAAGYPTLAPTLDSTPSRCHSFVTDGQIQFLSDCTHSSAGKTLPLEPFE